MVGVLYERRRGCGWRKPGGLYLVSDNPMEACPKLPIEVSTCPTCGQGVRAARGWTWIEYEPFINPGPHGEPEHSAVCVLAQPAESVTTEDGKVGLIWVGESFYKTPGMFMREALDMGISRRITAVPKGFKVGETLVLLGHRKAIVDGVVDTETGSTFSTANEAIEEGALFEHIEPHYVPGVFTAFRPSRIEYVLKPEEQDDWELIERLRARGIEPVIVIPIHNQEPLLVGD